MDIDLMMSFVLGFCLAAATGFRVFIPLLVLSLASYFDIISINQDFEWVGSVTAVSLLSVAVIVEVFAYFIPWVDNLLDTITVPAATIAGTLVMFATLSGLDPTYTWALAIIAVGETVASATVASASIFYPFAALFLVLITGIILWRIVKKVGQILKS